MLNQVYKDVEYGIDVKNRIVYLDGEIDIYSVSTIHARINALLHLSKNAKTPITLQLACYGGDVYAMFGILDIMRTTPCKVYTRGLGAVMSAATFILAAGTKGHREIGSNTIVMIHEMSSWFQGTTKDILAEATHVKDLQNKLYSTLHKFSNQPPAFWEKKGKVNLYLTPEDCVKYGLVDKILG